MLKSAITRPWICSRCTRRYATLRHNSTQASAVVESQTRQRGAAPQRSRTNHVAPGAVHDDRILRQVFDNHAFWKEFSQSSKSGENVGLFTNRYLRTPEGFNDFVAVSLGNARKVVKRILEASTPEQYYRIVRDLDRLSDLLCRVIDLSDFVRASHPDQRFQAAATQAYSMMFEYMNILNTTTGLSKQLDVALAMPESARWGEQETMVAHMLKRDFARSAIDGNDTERERFVQLSQDISVLGSEFTGDMRPEKPQLVFPSSRLQGMDPMLVRQLTRWGQVTLPTVGDAAVSALRSVQDEEVRRQIYNANHTSARGNIERLHELLSSRLEVARLSNYETYGHMALGDKMAQSPEAVSEFLQALSADNRADVESISADLLRQKLADPNALSKTLQPWDKMFYISQMTSKMRSKSRNSDSISSYLSLGRVMQGLSRLFTRLYGIRFVPHETRPGETWNSDVRRLDVISESEGHVAVLYCDLFARRGKSPNPAHFTLRCSRLIGNDEIEEFHSTNGPLFYSPEEAANDGMAFSPSKENDGIMQLPTIALICDFDTTPGSNRPALLSFSELSTLFHEMGHAIHSILGRTNFQNVAGTRCATDFAELPSVLMEHFAADKSVLSLFASHYETDQPLPYELISQKLKLDRQFEGAEVENQIILSILDQACHGSLPSKADFNSTTIYHSIQRQQGVLPPDPPETSWQGFFGHLAGYGATYYSYLFDRVLARRIWGEVFDEGKEGRSLSGERGERMKNAVLKHGASRDPWKCLSDVLKDERVRKGGKEAMGIVGGWGIKERREGEVNS